MTRASASRAFSVTGAGLNSRVRDLNRLRDSLGNAVQTSKAAAQGPSAITKLVESAQATARQALQKPGIAPASVSGTSAAVAADVAATVTGTGTLLADRNGVYVGTGNFAGGTAGTFDINGHQVTVGADDTITDVTNAIQGVLNANSIAATATNDGTDITITNSNADVGDLTIDNFSAGVAAAIGFDTQTITTERNLLDQGITGGQTLTVTVGSGSTQTITFGTGGGQVSTIAELNTAVGNLTGLSTKTVNATNAGISLTATSNADDIVIGGTATVANFGLTAGTLEPTNATIGALTGSSTLTIKIGGNATTTVTFGTGANVGNRRDLAAALTGLAGGTASIDGNGNLTVTATNNTDSIVIGGTTTLSTFGVGAGTTAPGQNADRAALETQFNNLRGQIDQLAADASFNGNNLLNGDSLTVIFNENNTSSLSITGVTFNSAGLGINAAATDSFQSNASINITLGELDTAISTLRQQASTFGSSLSVVEVRQDFTKNLINTLETGAANLTLADTNEEGANLLALQTRQQLSSVALSLASQADQNVLRLF